MMKVVRSIAFTLSVATVPMVVAACGGTVEQTPQTSASAATKAPVAVDARGPIQRIGQALGEVALRPEQRKEIEKLASDAEGRHGPAAQARKGLTLALADQIEHGAIDEAALKAKLDEVKAAVDKARAEDRAALVRLHGLLDAEQRNAFVDALEANMKGKRARFGERSKRADHGPRAKRGPHGEHGARGERGLRGPHTVDGARGGFKQHGFGALGRLSEELKLTDEQKAQLYDVMKQAREGAIAKWKARGDGAPAWKGRGERGEGAPAWKGRGGPMKALEAFRADTLDAEQLTRPGAHANTAAFGADRMIDFAVRVVPILTPEQRKIAADKIRAAAAGAQPMRFGR